jgi:hypothetical protein
MDEIEQRDRLIAAITQHIPPKGFHMVRRYGWYSNRARREVESATAGMLRPGDESEEIGSDNVTVFDVSGYDPPQLTSETWRQPQPQMSKRPPFCNPRWASGEEAGS